MPTTPLSRLAGAGEPGTFERLLLHAEVVYNGLGMPRADGGVLLQRAGASLSVADVRDRDGTARAFPEARLVDAGFAISPPVVNALIRPGQTAVVYDPLAALGAPASSLREAASALRVLQAAGTNVIGAVVTDEQVMRLLLAHSGLQGVAYWQVSDPLEQSARQTFERTVTQVTELRGLESPGGLRVGLSPATPYLVSAELMRLLTAWARSTGLPVAIRAAQNAAETQLSVDGSGPLARALTGAGLPVTPRGVTPIQYLSDLGALEGAPTLLQMVDIGPEDARLVARAGSVVVHCPRANSRDGAGAFPWQLYQRHAVEVAFGTDSTGADSTGSGDDVDVTAEVLAARDLHGASANPRSLVRAAVKGGHRALGLRPPQVLRGSQADALVAWR